MCGPHFIPVCVMCRRQPILYLCCSRHVADYTEVGHRETSGGSVASGTAHGVRGASGTAHGVQGAADVGGGRGAQHHHSHHHTTSGTPTLLQRHFKKGGVGLAPSPIPRAYIGELQVGPCYHIIVIFIITATTTIATTTTISVQRPNMYSSCTLLLVHEHVYAGRAGAGSDSHVHQPAHPVSRIRQATLLLRASTSHQQCKRGRRYRCRWRWWCSCSRRVAVCCGGCSHPATAHTAGSDHASGHKCQCGRIGGAP
jgi:hypothetical protein